jgi:hypothetical protein
MPFHDIMPLMELFSPLTRCQSSAGHEPSDFEWNVYTVPAGIACALAAVHAAAPIKDVAAIAAIRAESFIVTIPCRVVRAGPGAEAGRSAHLPAAMVVQFGFKLVYRSTSEHAPAAAE